MAIDYSGVYKVNSSATKDTLYDRDVIPISTTNLKIPNPTIKTGFVPTGGGRRRKRRRKL